MALVRAEYDFDAQPGTGEMDVKAGEILTVIRKNIEGGWMEGRNSRGQAGLFPESYCVPHYGAVTPAAAPAPPPLPPAPPALPPVSAKPFDDWGMSTFQSSTAVPSSASSFDAARQLPAPSLGTTSMAGDDFDDEWTDEDEPEDHRLSVVDNMVCAAAIPAALNRAAHRASNGSDEVRPRMLATLSGELSTDEYTDSAADGHHYYDDDVDGRRRSRSIEHRSNCRISSPSRHSSGRENQQLNGSSRPPSRQPSSRRRREHRTSRANTPSVKDQVSTGHGASANHHHHQQHDSRVVSRSHSAGAGERGGSKINRNINRFTTFVKSGMEAYVLGDSKMNGQASERHEILLSGTMVQWRPIQQYYTCTVDKPKKESKLKGLKSFIAYSITSSLRGIQVSRRYKHFDWLHEQLSQKYVLIPIPPLPEKQVSGRYEDDLIDHRKHILQLWVNKICRHPVLSQSEVWLHFITSTEESEWKKGKRKAEKDEYVGGNFLHCVTFPGQQLDINNVERQVDKFQRNVKITEDAMRVMQERLQNFQKLYQGRKQAIKRVPKLEFYRKSVKANWQKMAAAFSTLGQTFQTDDHPGAHKMSDALKHTAHHYHNIGEEFDVHTRNDMEPVVENLYSFKGTVQGVPEILSVHKQAIQKLRENETKVSSADADRISKRVDATSYAVMAEMNHLNTEKIEDLRATMGAYLKRQAEFYQKIANNLSELAQHYEF